jgi:hypothetical protein
MDYDNVLAQGDFSGPLTHKIIKALNPDGSKLKDSIAFYSWAYELSITKFKDSTIVEYITVNDSIAKVIIKDVSSLKAINFSSLLDKRDKAKLIIPISVIMTDYNASKEPTKMISFYDFSTRIRKLFNVRDGKEYDNNDIYFQPIMIYFSKKINDY